MTTRTVPPPPWTPCAAWPACPVAACELDLRDHRALDKVFARHQIEAVIHFAAKKAVSESMRIPIDYFDINIGGTTSLLRAMLTHDVRNLVFSSSCSIYGDQYSAPIVEEDQPCPTNPYARSKLICEQILADTCARYQDFSVIALRYFNPVGGHPSGLLGEDPRGIPLNVMPYMMQVAAGRREKLTVYGTDYDTSDGSGVRDYIHVMDVAEAHCVALDHLADETGLRALNIGTGTGVSVLELHAVFASVCGVPVPYEIAGRRPGDVGTLIADPGLVQKLWGWRTTRDLLAMCQDAWRFQQLHPDGYGPN